MVLPAGGGDYLKAAGTAMTDAANAATRKPAAGTRATTASAAEPGCGHAAPDRTVSCLCYPRRSVTFCY